MKKNKIKLRILLVLSLMMVSLFPKQQTFAREECAIGQTIFMNTIYGTSIGIGLGFLFMVAMQRMEQWNYVGRGGLYGAGAGIAVGLSEAMFFNDCIRSAPSTRFGQNFTIRPSITNSHIHKTNASHHFNSVGLSVLASYDF